MKVLKIILVLLVSTAFSIYGEESKDRSSIIDYIDMEQVMVLAKEKPTVLFFKANWCPSCKSAAKKFEAGIDQLKDVNLVIVNYDTSKNLQKKYGVTYQHTFVQVSPTGEAITKWNGGAVTELLQNIVKGEI